MTLHREPRRRPLLKPRPRLVLLFTLATATVASATAVSGAPDAAATSAVRIWNGKADAVTEGEVIVDAAPEVVYATLTSYDLWTTIFPYLARVDRKSGGRDDAVIQTTNRKGTRHTVRFRNDPHRLIVRFEEEGGRAEVNADISLIPGAASGTTVVRARLYADVHGVAGLFVSDSRIRKKREQKLTKDLAFIRDYFASVR
jgi:polyketide cyclase/dehydrase/lipid transport protein